MSQSSTRNRLVLPYRVHYAPPAWREVGRMSAEAFEALQQTLARLAERSRGQDSVAGPARHQVEGHGLELLYERDPRASTLTLLAVTRMG
ncbi:hypothetical protein G4177_28895 [Corallococcus sp. ZKHCc1 1396]|uniref:Type II toxin-antitoxin system RelE/ParE family toxin n=1 Tax=Corallococcus soli TaxID=2710757 RepID=A0ABR9PW96_9BACT|nr:MULTISPECIES: hypothetical protein [Corallococcus]MBE4752188.1 hypothetical protein [Corallococcus soli]MCY1029978.1 hypothetical protein [Corallococcus sp. BB11-1]